MVRWVVGSILHGVDPFSYFSFQPVLHDWCNKGWGMFYHVCGMVHITMKDRSDDPSHHERTLLPRSYISLLGLHEFKILDSILGDKNRPGLEYPTFTPETITWVLNLGWIEPQGFVGSVSGVAEVKNSKTIFNNTIFGGKGKQNTNIHPQTFQNKFFL